MIDHDDDHEIESIDDLVIQAEAPEAQRMGPTDDRPAIGSWWWLKSKAKGDVYKPKDYDEPGRRWIACVIEVGSNYAKLEGVKFSQRIALDDFHKLCKPEPNPEAYVATKVGFHKTRVREITGEIARVCALLGVPMRDALAAASELGAQALALVHGTADVDAYEKALVKAKDKTLPELFKEIEAEHKAMATWMKADLIPLDAQFASMKKITKMIDSKIEMVELYAGLIERLVCVLEGDPAPNDTKVTLMQRRHYMDEECLIRYQAGGMNFEDLEAFDKWLARREHMTRILPHERCIIAFKIRRWSRKYDGDGSLASWIQFQFEGQQDEKTFLYIRNGNQLWRLRTAIEFDAQLFPNKEDNELLNDSELWIKPSLIEQDKDWHGEHAMITRSQRNHMIESSRASIAARRAELAKEFWAWKRLGKPKGEWQYDDNGRMRHRRGAPDSWFNRGHDRDLNRNYDPVAGYELLMPDNIYFDDAMRRIRKMANEHNRLAVVIQGLLDRSTCLHPHPPWKLFTPEGFANGIELVYDDSRALTPGEAPSWEGYRTQLNKSLRVGAYTIGQRAAWRAVVGLIDGDRRSWEIRAKHGDGPKYIARIEAIKSGKALFSWTRDRQRRKQIGWRPSETPGYRYRVYDDSEISVRWWCPLSELFCVDAYTPGDFHRFYDDPRTRADYIEWAPYLLSSEDWHATRALAPDEHEEESDGDDS